MSNVLEGHKMEVLSEPISVTLDLNVLYDKAEKRPGSVDFDSIVDMAKKGRVAFFFTPTSDFEDRSGAAMKVAIGLMFDGLLREAPHAGFQNDFMPGGPGQYFIEDEKLPYDVIRMIWPNASFVSRSMDNKEGDVLGLLGHKYSGRDVYLTNDRELLKKENLIREKLGIRVMSPKALLAAIRV